LAVAVFGAVNGDRSRSLRECLRPDEAKSIDRKRFILGSATLALIIDDRGPVNGNFGGPLAMYQWVSEHDGPRMHFNLDKVKSIELF